jgi:ATP-dependent Clp protease adaptor protein ClpS
MTETENEISTTTVEDILMEKKLVLLNDHVNSFDHVILCLVTVLDYTAEQAEQVALIVHNKGRCIIKTGLFNELEPIYNQLSLYGLTLEIQ